MKIHKIALVGGALVMSLAGVTVQACSSSNSSSGDDAGNSSSGGGSSGGASSSGAGSSGGASSSGAGSSGGANDGGTGSSSGGGEDAACAKPPTLHVPEADGGIYCPYSYNDATDSGIQYCSGATPLCCVSQAEDAGPSTCAASCSATTTYTWQCSAPSDCAGTPAGDAGPIVCCLISGAVENDTKCNGYQKTEGLDSVTCLPASQCQGSITEGKYTDTHYVACEQQSDCNASAAAFGGDGGTCTPVFTEGTPIGLCL